MLRAASISTCRSGPEAEVGFGRRPAFRVRTFRGSVGDAHRRPNPEGTDRPRAGVPFGYSGEGAHSASAGPTAKVGIVGSKADLPRTSSAPRAQNRLRPAFAVLSLNWRKGCPFRLVRYFPYPSYFLEKSVTLSPNCLYSFAGFRSNPVSICGSDW